MLDLFIPRPSDCLSQPSTLVTTVRCPIPQWQVVPLCRRPAESLQLIPFPTQLLLSLGRGGKRVG